jgi:hypothetical protein
LQGAGHFLILPRDLDFEIGIGIKHGPNSVAFLADPLVLSIVEHLVEKLSLSGPRPLWTHILEKVCHQVLVCLVKLGYLQIQHVVVLNTML